MKLGKKKGFTIIEVVLVLAVAGLIFAMVFIALPRLRASQRDAARRNDCAVIASAVRQYMKKNRGRGPHTTSSNASGQVVDDETGETVNVSTGTDSAELRKYLTDLNEDVTTIVAVRNFADENKDKEAHNYRIGNPTMSGTVYVNIGARCPDGEPTYEKVPMIITHKRSDISIFRYMELSKFYCKNF